MLANGTVPDSQTRQFKIAGARMVNQGQKRALSTRVLITILSFGTYIYIPHQNAPSYTLRS